MKEKIKEFLKPVEGGHQHGLKFNKWFWHAQRAGLFFLFPIVIMLLAIFEGPNTGWDPTWSFYGVEVGLFLIWCLIIYKGIIQHWNDLKNHTSR